MSTNINTIDAHKAEVEWLEERLKEAVELNRWRTKMKIYLIVHYELDGDLRSWECQDDIAFTTREKAEEFVKTHTELKYYIEEIDLL